MKLLDGLFLYEIIMLGMGVFLFLLLSIALAVKLVRSRPYGRLLPAFGLPIVMVGFPGIQSFEISGNTLKIQTKVDALQTDPTNAETRASLSAAVDALSARPVRNPDTSLAIARAQIALGQNTDAEQRVDRVLQQAPQLAAAQELKQRIELDRKLVTLTAALKTDAANPAAKTELAHVVRQATRLQIASPQTLASIAQAQVALGQHEEAQKNVSKALTINPNLATAMQLKKEIGAAPAAAAPAHSR